MIMFVHKFFLIFLSAKTKVVLNFLLWYKEGWYLLRRNREHVTQFSCGQKRLWVAALRVPLRGIFSAQNNVTWTMAMRHRILGIYFSVTKRIKNVRPIHTLSQLKQISSKLQRNAKKWVNKPKSQLAFF